MSSSTFFLFLLSLFPDLHPLKLLFPDLHRNSMATMAKNKCSSSSSVCHHSPPASPPTMVEDFGSLSLGYFSFSRPSWPHTLSRLSLSLLSHWSSKAPMAWTRARTPSRTHSHSHRSLNSLTDSFSLSPRFLIWPRLPHRSSTATMAMDKSSQALTLSFLWLQPSQVWWWHHCDEVWWWHHCDGAWVIDLHAWVIQLINGCRLFLEFVKEEENWHVQTTCLNHFVVAIF